jgi:hypothetical protein
MTPSTMVLCVTFAAVMALSIDDAMAKAKGPCSAWARAYHDAKKRGDYATASQAHHYLQLCLVEAAMADPHGSPMDPSKPTHKRIKPRKGAGH